MALVGNGAQPDFQALAFYFLCGIRNLRLYDSDPAASRKLVRNLRPFAIDTEVCNSVLQACQGADIITTVTADTSHAEIITPAMVTPGMHVNAVGGDSPGKTEIAPAVLTQASVFVEFEPQTRVEGEIQRQPADFAVTEFWQVLQGVAPGRTSARQITVFDSVGFALEAFSALRFMREAAASLGLLVPIDLIPLLKNPKDLFSLVADDAATVVAIAPAAMTS